MFNFFEKIYLINLEERKDRLEKSLINFKNYEDERGLTVYTVGAYANYEDANKAKAAVVSQGITDAFIVAYRDGNKITIDEAKQLLNK
jgi:hypothetical protein